MITGASMDHITMHIGKKMENSKRNTLVQYDPKKRNVEGKLIWKLIFIPGHLKTSKIGFFLFKDTLFKILM